MVEGIRRSSDWDIRSLALERIFDSPSKRYGKGHDWSGFTPHDCAILFLSYLKGLPEPIIPFGRYHEFAAAFRHYSDRKLLYDCWPEVKQIAKNS